jgi:hypothetical protein
MKLILTHFKIVSAILFSCLKIYSLSGRMFLSVPVVEKSQKVDYQTPLKIISLKSQPDGCFAVLELIRKDVTRGTRTCHAHNKDSTEHKVLTI